MSLLNAALLPHSPLLIPEIGQANYDFLAKTIDAYKKIGEELRNTEIETIIIISPHGKPQNNSFTMNVAPEMEINLQDFGFIPPKTVLSGDALLADQIKNELRSDYEIQLISENILDHGSAVPLYLMKNLIGEFKTIIISPASGLELETLSEFGKKLGNVIKNNNKKIAIIASGDLSHRLKKKSPGGYSPKGAKFDNKLIEYLNEPRTALNNILKMDANLINDAGECGLKPLVVALGALEEKNWEPEVLAYQTDFGIGYLSFKFEF